MELDIGYNTTLKAAELNAIMINKVFFFLTKKKKAVTSMVASVFWAVCGGLQNSMVKMEFLLCLFLNMILS